MAAMSVQQEAATVDFVQRGFALVDDVLPVEDCNRLANHLREDIEQTNGTRNALGLSWCRELACQLGEHALLTPLLPPAAVAVQCTIFDKSTGHNWLVGLHQDLSIPVRERIDEAQCSGWAAKESQLFVQPPASLLERLVAVRIHLDSVEADNGPLRVVPGSHRYGRLCPQEARDLRDRVGETVCLVPKGGALVMRPLLLHASSKISGEKRRRVLHFLFGPASLPFGLAWPNKGP